MITEVPWTTIPHSEPVLPGERSSDLLLQRGIPIYVPLVVTIIARMTTTEAQRLIERGEVSIDGVTARASWTYLKPGAVIKVGADRTYRIGSPENGPPPRSNRAP
jgi:hypothetical protein